MSGYAALSYAVLVVAAGTLFYAALTDLREFRIPNELVLVLAGLFFVHAFLSGRWTGLHLNVAVAAVAFVVLLFCYSRGWLGGGDVKLLTVALLWAGPHCALVFSVLLTVFACVHLLAYRLGWAGFKVAAGRKRVAYAPSIAAALIGTFMSGCLHPIA